MELSHARIPGPGAPAGQRTAQGGQLLYCSIAQWGGGCGGVYGLAGLLLLAHSKSVDPRYLTLMGSGFDGPYHHLTGARKRSRTAADGDMHAGCIQQELRWDPASNDRRDEPNAPRCPFLEGQVVTWTTKVGGSIRLLDSIGESVETSYSGRITEYTKADYRLGPNLRPLRRASAHLPPSVTCAWGPRAHGRRGSQTESTSDSESTFSLLFCVD
jgi:hypothetical protein